MKIFTVDDSYFSFTFKKGEEFQVQLKQIGSTGYTWTPLHFDGMVLEKVSSETINLPAPGVFGGGSDELITFLAKSEGITSILSYLKRPWLPNEVPIDVLAVTIIVE